MTWPPHRVQLCTAFVRIVVGTSVVLTAFLGCQLSCPNEILFQWPLGEFCLGVIVYFFYEKGQLQLLQKYIFWATISSNLILLLLCYKECERVAATAGQKTVGGFQDHRSCVRYENTNLIKKWWVKTCVKRLILNTILPYFLQGQLILGDASNWWHGRPVSKD